jgi:hypothetical protein
VVGRELPNSRPLGEDHRGAIGGDIRRKKTEMYAISGARDEESSRSCKATTEAIYMALGFLYRVIRGSLVIRFISQA